LPFLSQADRFDLTERIDLALAKGRLSINELSLTDPLGRYEITSALSLQGLDLMALAETLDIPGTLSAELLPVRLDKENLRIEGVWKAGVFDGLVEGKNWEILRPWDDQRTFQGDLFFSHLELESISRRFSLGKITGYIQGRVMGLAVRDHRPLRFDLSVKTQEVPETPKRIQIKAIENLNLLGSGWGDFDVFRQGISRWIDEYEYREIGLAGRLEDNRFSLRGTIVEDGVEYLVRSPGWFGIDVINKNPDNEIQFSDILDRIQRMKTESR
jgi:hypothetical protein